MFLPSIYQLPTMLVGRGPGLVLFPGVSSFLQPAIMVSRATTSTHFKVIAFFIRLNIKGYGLLFNIREQQLPYPWSVAGMQKAVIILTAVVVIATFKKWVLIRIYYTVSISMQKGQSNKKPRSFTSGAVYN